MGAGVHVISQDDIIPNKLFDYLARHPEMEGRLSRSGTFEIYATDTNEHFTHNVTTMMGAEAKVKKAVY
jgi:glutamate racemase